MPTSTSKSSHSIVRIIANREELEEFTKTTPINTQILGSSNHPLRNAGTTYIRMEPILSSDADEWYDTGNEYNVGPDDIMLPVMVTFVPQITGE